MIRKASIAGILMLGLVLSAGRTAPAYGHLVTSAHSFRQSFQALQSAGDTVNAVERFVFSIVLANTAPKAERQPKITAPNPT